MAREVSRRCGARGGSSRFLYVVSPLALALSAGSVAAQSPPSAGAPPPTGAPAVPPRAAPLPAQPPASAAATAGVGASTETNAAQPGAGAGEIVVTATRRSERLRDVPSTVNAVTGAQLAAKGPITNTGDILATVPGVRFNNLASPLLSEVSIRGSGTERATGADPAVGLFANGVYVGGGIGAGGYGRNFSPIDSFDLDRAEVLEGPQGALYGRNAEFGVVNLISNLPVFKNTGFVDDVYSFEDGANRATAVVNYKVNDDWAVRFGVEQINQSSGFFHNPDDDKYLDASNGWLGRGQIRYRHGRLDVTLSGQIQRLRLPSFWSADDVPGGGQFPTLPLGFSQDPYNTPHNGNDYSREDISQGTLLVNYDFDWAKLTSTTSYRVRSTTKDIDKDYIDPAQEAMLQSLGEKGLWPFAQTDSFDRERVIYQDVHLAGAAFDRRLNWLVGGEFLQQRGNSADSTSTDPCATNTQPNPVVGAGVCAGTPAMPTCYLLLPTSRACPAVFPAQTGAGSWGSEQIGSGYYNSGSAYGSLGLKLGYGFTLTGDGRYTNDHKSYNLNLSELYTGEPLTFNTGGVAQPPKYDFDSGKFTYTVTLSEKLPVRWDTLLYAKVGTGYRAGGFNFGETPPAVLVNGKLVFENPGGKPAPVPLGYAPLIPSYGDEDSISYELGVKGEVTRHIFYTADAYVEHQSDALAAVGDGCTNVNSCQTANSNYTINAGTAHGSGIEASINASYTLFGGPLTLAANGSTQEAKYVAEPPRTGVPLVGTPVAQNPHWLAAFTGNYRHRLFEGTEGFVNVVYHGQWGGCQDSITPGQTCVHLSDFQTVDLRFGLDWKRIEFAVVTRNLNDAIYKLAQYQQISATSPTGVVFTQQRLNIPRTIGLELTYRW